MGKDNRTNEIRRRQARRHKLLELRRKYAAAKSEGDRQKVLAKVMKVAPTMSPQLFITLAKPGASTT